jgi:hypothetical protein
MFIVFVALVLLIASSSEEASPSPRVATTSESTATTWWTESVPALPPNFSELVAGGERAKVKAKRAASARRHLFVAAYASEVQQIIYDGFSRFGPVVAQEAVNVAGCETGHTYDPSSRNGSHVGLFQLSETYHRARAERLGFQWSQMVEARANVAVAADLYAEQGWQPWTCRWAA